MNRRTLGAMLVPTAAATAVAGVLTSPGHAAQEDEPDFQAPFTCGETWTYSHHSQEVRRALDFVHEDGTGATKGAPVIASAPGEVSDVGFGDGSGYYVHIDHGGGWVTYYYHLAEGSTQVEVGDEVDYGDQVGDTGTTGQSSGPHIHYEQLLDGDGRDIVLDGEELPYPPEYGQESLTSKNGCDGDEPGDDGDAGDDGRPAGGDTTEIGEVTGGGTGDNPVDVEASSEVGPTIVKIHVDDPDQVGGPAVEVARSER